MIIRIGISGSEKLEVIPAGEFFPHRSYGVVLRKGRILTPQARLFVGLLLEGPQLANGGEEEPKRNPGPRAGVLQVKPPGNGPIRS